MKFHMAELYVVNTEYDVPVVISSKRFTRKE